MGEDEYGKSQLYLDGVILDRSEVGITPVKIPSSCSYKVVPGTIEGSFTLETSDSSWRDILWSMALHEAREQAAEFNQWIKEKMVGSRLPRKSKKWCKKVIALRIAKGFGIEAGHLLKYIKVKKR